MGCLRRLVLDHRANASTAGGGFDGSVADNRGLASEIGFIDPLEPTPPSKCGPFESERGYLEAVAFAPVSDTLPLALKI